jgi:hypothetical protein
MRQSTVVVEEEKWMNPKNRTKLKEKRDQVVQPVSRKDQPTDDRSTVGRVEDLREQRDRLFEQDALGRTPLFYAAEKGLQAEVEEMIFSLQGTGLAPARLSLITMRDRAGLTAADVAEQNGHEEIARLLRGEQGRMEYYE